MRKAGIAGALALAVVGCSFAFSGDGEARMAFRPRSHLTLNEGHIARLRAVLKLNAVQQTLWPPVAAAMRSVIREQRGATSEPVQLASSSRSAALDSSKVQRVMTAAMPLLATLSEEQKRHARQFAHSLGLDGEAVY